MHRGEDALAEIHNLIALIMNPSEHGVINSSPSLFDGVNEILDNSIIFHLAFPFCQIGIHVVAGHEIILIIDAVLF
jgi:hypothetical protein